MVNVKPSAFRDDAKQSVERNPELLIERDALERHLQHETVFSLDGTASSQFHHQEPAVCVSFQLLQNKHVKQTWL